METRTRTAATPTSRGSTAQTAPATREPWRSVASWAASRPWRVVLAVALLGAIALVGVVVVPGDGPSRAETAATLRLSAAAEAHAELRSSGALGAASARLDRQAAVVRGARADDASSARLTSLAEAQGALGTQGTRASD